MDFKIFWISENVCEFEKEKRTGNKKKVNPAKKTHICF